MKIIAFVLSFALMLSSAFADDAALTKLLKDNKCEKCHKVTALGLADAKGKAPDLSHLSKDATGYEKGAKAWIQGWLKKEITKGGKKHAMAWKGSDADLGTLADGLIELDGRK
ncbi:MAG: hypothetical protein HYV97_16915 [Bdellovibrio sp.]|nr:hypothetical protein [Bdellovibrio sp.]